jgi:hypothetical protein
MIDRKHIGTTLPKATLEIEKGRLRFFAKAIGETDPIYTDEAAAQTAAICLAALADVHLRQSSTQTRYSRRSRTWG